MSKEQKVPFSAIGMVLAMGIVFGDLGTSPLYVMKAIVGSLPEGSKANPDYILGAISCIIWTLTLQTTVKYVFITLRADNHGEGGILSLFALIRKNYRWAYIIAAIGASMLLADGVITPAITVTSAIEGLNVLQPSLPVVPITILILVILFLLQPLGTSRLGKSFGSIMLLWFTMLGILGLASIPEFLPILKSFNPYYAVTFLMQSPNALIILGAVFLCTTGAEALYSDLGHCGLENIRISWLYVKITLVLNYLGQGAWIIANPTLLTENINPFFSIMPEWFSMAGVVMATLAAIIASQALISGSFTIISEAISLDIWPNIHIKYPTLIKGQMYIPLINHTLLVLCVFIVLLFKNSSNMEAAYGLAITVTMMMTSCLLFIYLLNKKVSLFFSIPITLFFLTIETGFFIANMLKFRHGGYITILIAGVLFFVMYVWYNGRRIKNRSVRYTLVKKHLAQIERISEDNSIPKYCTHLVYVTRAKYKDELESKIIQSLFKNQPKRADTYWFVYLRKGDEPYEFSYEVTTFVPKKIFRLDITAGFKMGIHVDTYVHQICKSLQNKDEVDLVSRYPSLREENVMGDFRFVVVERIVRNLDMPIKQRFILSIYYAIKRISTSDTEILDLDPSVVSLEYVPLKNLRQTPKSNQPYFAFEDED